VKWKVYHILPLYIKIQIYFVEKQRPRTHTVKIVGFSVFYCFLAKNG